MTEESVIDVLRKLTVDSTSGATYDERRCESVWVANHYSKAQLVRDLREALNG